MSVGPKPADAELETQRHYASASSLNELLEAVLAELRTHTPFERFVLVASLDGHATGEAIGVPRAEVDAFVGSLVHWDPSVIEAAEDRAPDSPLAALESMRSAVLVPAATSASEFFVVAAVEAEDGHPELTQVREVLRIAAPFVFRRTEVHALRARVAELSSQQVRSRMALDTLPDPVLVMDPDSRILLANRRVEELLVSDPDDSQGRRHAVETNNLHFSAFRARAILESGRAHELLLVDPKDGSDLLFEGLVLPLRGTDIVPDSSLFMLRDITDLKHTTHELELQFGRSLAAEHKARRESERMNVIIENAGVPILVTDRQTNVVLMNREAERLLEVSWSGSRASPQAHDIRANDAKLAGFINEFLLQPRLRREGRLALVDPDEAREFPVLAVSRKILDDHYEPTGVVTVLHDLTQEVENQHLANKLQNLNAELEARVAAATHELERRNAQLERQSNQLARASLLKTEFLATMSHELRTPINAVLGYNSLLREGLFGELTEKQDDALERMRGAAEHLLALINDILDLSSVESGKIQVSPTDLDLVAFLERLSESVGPMARMKSLDYVLEMDPRLPRVRTDGTRLRQVLLNLLSNAVKFTLAGTVTVRAAPCGRGDRVSLEVIDTGIGIGEENIEKIFDEFTQVDQSVTRQAGGTGLGLTISRKLIGLMGGSLTVSSTFGEGTTFRVELPLVPPTTSVDEDQGDRRPSLEPDPQSVR